VAHPDGVAVDVFDGDDVGREVDVLDGFGDHHQPFAGGERVVNRVRDVRAPDAQHEFVDFVDDVLDHRAVAVVERLEPADVESASHS
jgi:hypothetical protein